MVLLPAVSLESAQKGIALWASDVMPALLPFFICANFIILIGIPSLIGRFFERSFQSIFGAPGCSAFVFIISITSGYPMGPKLIGDMGRRGEITLDEAKRMLTFCSTSGPLFMLGAVGAGMFHSPLAGAAIAASHYIGAVLNGILYNITERGIKKSKHNKYKKKMHSRKNAPVYYKASINSDSSLLEMFTDSILSALKTLGIICCYIVLFTMITDILELGGVFNHFPHGYQRGVIKGLLEMTVGCSTLSLSEGTGMRTACILASFLVSFGGFSIFAQSMSVLYGLNISPFFYLKAKLMHGILSGITAYFISPYILNRSVNTAGAFGFETLNYDLGFLSQLLFSTRMIIIVLIIFIISAGLDCLIDRKENTLI